MVLTIFSPSPIDILMHPSESVTVFAGGTGCI